MTDKITSCLWFDAQGEEAANFFTSIPNSKVDEVARYGEAGPGAPGTVMASPSRSTAAASWCSTAPRSSRTARRCRSRSRARTRRRPTTTADALTAGGEAGPCGWLKDRFGVSWQVVPGRMIELISDPDPERAARAFKAMMGMSKLDISRRGRRGRVAGAGVGRLIPGYTRAEAAGFAGSAARA